MRNDLPSLNAGKAMAQASHASNQMVHHIRTLEGDLTKKNIFIDNLNEWEGEANGFGTCIVLGASKGEINDILENHTLYDHAIAQEVVDPTYPFFASTEMFGLFDTEKVTGVLDTVRPDGTMLFLREEVTCAYIFGEKESIERYVSNLKLHP